MSCLFSPNQTITNNLQWWQIIPALLQNQTCGETYLRPDVGGALMPWLFTLFQIVVHLPVIYVRVARWEDVQTLSIVLAAINVAIVSQAYASTKLAAEHVLVWSPMTLVLDAGAMLQLVILVKAEHPNWRRELWEWIRQGRTKYRTDTENSDSPDAGIPLGNIAVPQAGSPTPSDTRNSRQSTGSISPEPLERDNAVSKPVFVAFVIITSSLLFIAIFGLQLRGLVAAFSGHRNPSIEASWCSPMFGFSSIAEVDLDCTFNLISTDPRRGIGCITLPGKRQETWLTVTIIAVLMSLAVEIFDFLLLWRLHDQTCLLLALRRPWFTMIFGLAVLVGILSIGTSDAYNLPPGISSKVFVILNAGNPTICSGELTPAGLRGQFLGWLDGLLQGWGPSYFGLTEKN